MHTKPNILFFFTDMQRADTIHALGNPIIKTPNLDRLVKEGTAFTNCYSPSPVCIPARCCMQYGIYPQKTGLFVNGRMMDDNDKSFAEILNQTGYKTQSIGKCHFTPDAQANRGFQNRIIQEECKNDRKQDDYIAYLEDNNLDYFEPHGARGEMYYIPQISSLSQEHNHPTAWIGDKTIDFVEENNSDKPWMLFSSFIHPHPPFAPPKPWHKLYRTADMPSPIHAEDDKELYTYINHLQNRYKYRDNGGQDINLMRTIKAYYYATISFVDYQIGRVLDSLEETGQLENTIIVFSSDHGEYLGDYNCFGKRGMQDQSSNIPMIIRYPEKIKQDNICRTPVSLVDILPTFADVAGASIDKSQFDGQSLINIQNNDSDRKYVYSQFGDKDEAIYMITSEQWKYIYSVGDRKELLFDKINDTTELFNQAKTRTSVKEKIKQDFLKHFKNINYTDAFDENNGKLDWKQYPLKNMSFLNDPEANLLKQDYEPEGTTLPPAYS